MICEKCWADAYLESLGTGKSQYQCYLKLLEERKDNPCQPESNITPVPADKCTACAKEYTSSCPIRTGKGCVYFTPLAAEHR